MNYVGIDIHKKYSVLCALDETGRKLREGRVEGNSPSGFAQFYSWGFVVDDLERNWEYRRHGLAGD